MDRGPNVQQTPDKTGQKGTVMSSQPNLGTLTILDRGEYLSTTIRTQKGETTGALNDVYGVLPPRDGQTEGPRQFNWDQAQEDNIDLVDNAVLGVQEASKSHRGTKILVAGEFRNRAKVAKVLRNHHRSMQQIIQGCCGEEGLKLVGLDVPPTRRKLGVREQYGLIYRQMGHPALPDKLSELARTHSGASTPDVAGFLSVMETNIQAFEAAQASLNEAKKRRDQAYANKQTALGDLRNVVVNVARIQEGYYRLAGLDDLADRMRLTIPRSRRSNPDNAAGGSETDPDLPGTGEGSEPAAESGTEPTSP